MCFKKYFHIFLILFFVFLSAYTQNQSDMERLIKAGYVQKFTQFVEWPADSTGNASKNFRVGFWKVNPYRDALFKVFKNKKIYNKNIIIKKINKIEEIKSCQVLIIPSISKNELHQILDFTRGKAILTVSDTEGFAEAGVCINLFINSEGYIQFEINYPVMLRTGLRADSRLFKLARIIS